MKKSECTHYPKNIIGSRSSSCEEGDESPSLRVCLTCGYVGCCDSSPGQHARKHAEKTGHVVVSSYPIDENSFEWCYEDNDYLK